QYIEIASGHLAAQHENAVLSGNDANPFVARSALRLSEEVRQMYVLKIRDPADRRHTLDLAAECRIGGVQVLPVRVARDVALQEFRADAAQKMGEPTASTGAPHLAVDERKAAELDCERHLVIRDAEQPNLWSFLIGQAREAVDEIADVDDPTH